MTIVVSPTITLCSAADPPTITPCSAAGPPAVRLHLAPTPTAAGEARRVVEAACRSWGIGHAIHPATIVITELVTNAVQHAATNLTVEAAYRRNRLSLSVEDGSRTPPTPSDIAACGDVPPSDLPEHGRGLHLVDAYSTAWGYRPTTNGKAVWATL